MTLMGQHTVDELKDLLTSHDVMIGRVREKYAEIGPRWQSEDQAAWQDWTNDWNTFETKYSNAKTLAQATISIADASPVSNSVIIAETQYNLVLKALKNDQVNSTITKGDFQDLYNRISEAAAKLDAAPPDMSSIPQPQATDIDLEGYKAADKTLKKVGKKSTEAAWLIGIGAATSLIATFFAKRVFKF